MRMLLIAAVLLGTLPGASTEALSQETESDSNASRLGTVERRVDEAEDVIVEQVLALRHRVETLEDQMRVLQAEIATLRGEVIPARGHSRIPIPKPSVPVTPPPRSN